jgi:glutamate---cysteine ligase / carboxylate-amine ligase
MSLIRERPRVPTEFPDWGRWSQSAPYVVGVEEEIMVLDPRGWGLARDSDGLLSDLGQGLAGSVAGETHQAVLELTSAPHTRAADAAEELAGLRESLNIELGARGLQAAAAGTHPQALWTDVQVSSGRRYQDIYESMRELARREPTFAQHVHVGVEDPEQAVNLLNRLRAHLPLLLALSANSPFWQGRDSGLASARTSIFQAFPRVGIPRQFADYSDYVEAVDRMLRCGAFADPTFLWWDVRLQPRFGTVEVRIMDAQSTSDRTGVLAALVQSIAHLELEEGYYDSDVALAPEILDENRFLAARDGMEAQLLDPVAEDRVRARELLEQLLEALVPHARALGCGAVLDSVHAMAHDTGERRQRRVARSHGLDGLMTALAADFTRGDRR